MKKSLKRFIENAGWPRVIIGLFLLSLFILAPFSNEFYVILGVCAVFDFADGFLAKRMNAETYFGDRLDHITSILTVIAVTSAAFSVLYIPHFVFFWMIGVFLVKIFSLIIGAVKYKKAAFVNTRLNKIAKTVFYLFPLLMFFAGIVFAYVTVLAVATVACAEELFINFTSREYDRNIVTVFKPIKLRKNK